MAAVSYTVIMMFWATTKKEGGNRQIVFVVNRFFIYSVDSYTLCFQFYLKEKISALHLLRKSELHWLKITSEMLRTL